MPKTQELDDLKAQLKAALSKNAETQTAAQKAEKRIASLKTKKGVGRPVPTSPASVGALAPQYSALRDEVTANNPIMSLSPEVQKMMAQAGKVTSNMLSGVINPDVQAQVQRISAENAIKGGLGMSSQASRNMTARDLGLTSMDIQSKGLEAAKALGDFDAGLMGQRMNFLTTMRGQDIDAKQVKLQNQQFNKELELNRFKLLSDTITGYYQLSFGYEQQKKSSRENVEQFNADLRAKIFDPMGAKMGTK